MLRNLLLNSTLLLFIQCSVFSKTIIEFSIYDKKCTQSGFFISDLCDDENEILGISKTLYEINKSPKPDSITINQLASIQKEYGYSIAVGYYYNSLLNDPLTQEIHSYVLRHRTNIPKVDIKNKYHVVHVPGMFYKTSNLLEGLKSFESVFKELDFKFSYVPIEETGTVFRNAEMICDYVKTLPDEENILFLSSSKGGADIKIFFNECDGKTISKIKVWFNIGGINKGTDLADSSKMTNGNYIDFRLKFLIGGYNWKGFQSIKRDPNSLLFKDLNADSLPMIVNIIGIPLERHISLRAAESYVLLKPFGPNDGFTFLADNYMPGAYNYAALRNDHYFWRMRDVSYIKSFVSFTISKLENSPLPQKYP